MGIGMLPRKRSIGMRMVRQISERQMRRGPCWLGRRGSEAENHPKLIGHVITL